MIVEIRTYFCADSKAWGDGEANGSHLRQIGALAAQQSAHGRVTIGLAAKIINVLCGFLSCRFAGIRFLFHGVRVLDQQLCASMRVSEGRKNTSTAANESISGRKRVLL
jgi:hypothetical protein